MKLSRSRLLEIIVVLFVLSYPIISEIIYYQDISPNGLSKFEEFSGKISDSSPVRVFESKEIRIINFKGLGPRRGFLAVPSAAPEYYFDETGTFLGWVRDSGDMKVPDKWRALGKVERISFDEAERRIAARGELGQN